MLPPDPAAFIAAAETGINAYDLPATAAAYAPGARLEALTDGSREVYEGAEAIRTAWAAYLDAMRARSFTLRKTIIAVDGDLIVNEWSGSIAGRTDARGIEHWRFDDQGRVAEHRMYTFLAVRPSRHPLARILLGLASPRAALAFLRAQKRHGAKPS